MHECMDPCMDACIQTLSLTHVQAWSPYGPSRYSGYLRTTKIVHLRTTKIVHLRTTKIVHLGTTDNRSFRVTSPSGGALVGSKFNLGVTWASWGWFLGHYWILPLIPHPSQAALRSFSKKTRLAQT